MATLKEIKRRITSVKSTQKITKAMKMVAAAKLRKAQANIVAARPYAYKLGELLVHLSERIEPGLNPLISRREEIGGVCLVVVTADRGLCGAFNSNLLRRVDSLIKTDLKPYSDAGKLKIITAGRKGDEFLVKRDYPVTKRFYNFFNTLEFKNAADIVDTFVDLYLRGEADRVLVLYNEFKSAVQQNIVLEETLPIEHQTLETTGKSTAHIDYEYEPGRMELVNTLVPKHLKVQMWRILLESYAAEQGGRMTAMETATENAGEMISSLQLSYNRARQESITTALLEIVSGAEALSKG